MRVEAALSAIVLWCVLHVVPSLTRYSFRPKVTPQSSMASRRLLDTMVTQSAPFQDKLHEPAFLFGGEIEKYMLMVRQRMVDEHARLQLYDSCTVKSVLARGAPAVQELPFPSKQRGA